MAASTARHETRALLRAHLAAASGYRHLTRHCPICHRLLRLAMEPAADSMEPVTGFLEYVTASGATHPPEPPGLPGEASAAAVDTAAVAASAHASDASAGEVTAEEETPVAP
ncbi:MULTISPECIES: DUF6274 family protein [unclassified Streptomyces]|uniref:DUF6274 family protein n=1 Tax=unclassified Streptomyces TaxID=2593676 RepID=UPI002DDB32E2|nr:MULTISPECIES: DUF6274 family protein [unclassified Streptomyces]WSC37896.1 DUF6274 family protein [Streptomyces sp. NBC_01763]WSD25675.1 DUF6274 family protein [Streptomyces sp. NBC_01751]WSF85818.1 DUF6274 family protein [Streptomyces sp. NBC_01744]WSJ52365.1 DUF6274 family protein [Streptomyces sp. NBC_01318]